MVDTVPACMVGSCEVSMSIQITKALVLAASWWRRSKSLRGTNPLIVSVCRHQSRRKNSIGDAGMSSFGTNIMETSVRSSWRRTSPGLHVRRM